MTQDTTSPPVLSAPVPARLQQGWAPSSPQPCHAQVCQWAQIPAWSQPNPNPREVSGAPGGCGCPGAPLLTRGWHRLWLAGPALTNPWVWVCQPLQGPDSYTEEFGIFWKLFTEKIAGMVGYLLQSFHPGPLHACSHTEMIKAWFTDFQAKYKVFVLVFVE